MTCWSQVPPNTLIKKAEAWSWEQESVCVKQFFILSEGTPRLKLKAQRWILQSWTLEMNGKLRGLTVLWGSVVHWFSWLVPAIPIGVGEILDTLVSCNFSSRPSRLKWQCFDSNAIPTKWKPRSRKHMLHSEETASCCLFEVVVPLWSGHHYSEFHCFYWHPKGIRVKTARKAPPF